MPRVKTGVVRKAAHKKIFDANKGYRMAKRKLYKTAKEAFLHAGAYAFAGRRLKKRDFRSLWIKRINAALKSQIDTITYSKFIKQMSNKSIKLNRQILSGLAVNFPKVFSSVFTFVANGSTQKSKN